MTQTLNPSPPYKDFRMLAEIRADIEVLERKTDELLEQILADVGE